MYSFKNLTQQQLQSIMLNIYLKDTAEEHLVLKEVIYEIRQSLLQALEVEEKVESGVGD